MSDDRDTLSWKTLEYAHRPKSSDWFWALGIIAAAGAAAAVFAGNILFALVILLGAFALALFAGRKPNAITVTLTDRGVLVDKRLYPFPSLASFFVSLDEESPRLLLAPKNSLLPQLSVMIEDVSPDDVRIFLVRHLEEKEQDVNSLWERIAEQLGF